MKVEISSKSKIIAGQIRTIAERNNVSVFGICPASEMADEELSHKPDDLLPGAQSLICFGIPVPRNVYNMKMNKEEMIWRSQNLNYRKLDMLSLRLANLLEENGAAAIPIYGCQPMDINERGVVAGYLNQIRMAELTGIGTVGKNGLLVHSVYGSRLMLGGVITDAVLPRMLYPDVAPRECPPDCRICDNACPVNAIMTDKKKVKIMRCLGFTAKTPSMSKFKFLFLKACNKKAAARYMSMATFDEHTFHICSKCVELCPYGELS